MALEEQERLRRSFLSLVEAVRRRGLSSEVERLQDLLADVEDPVLRGEMARLLGFYWLRRGHLQRAIYYSELSEGWLGGHRDCAYNAMYAEFSLGRFSEAVQRGRRAMQRYGEEAFWHNLISTCLGHLGHLEEAHHHGNRALTLKDAATAADPGRSLDGIPLPPFEPGRPQSQIISFSLFGSQRKYLEGAIANAEAVGAVYPGWTCRFHLDDSVPSAVVEMLEQKGAQIVRRPSGPQGLPGTFWRFQVADDPAVSRYLVRDADSLLNIREAAAVQEWLDSDRHFHVMRDHFDHSELVLAGMWGGVRNALPPVSRLFSEFLTVSRSKGVENRTADQEFLRMVLWPILRRSVLVHDSQFAFGDHRDFPAEARLPEGCWVGGDGRQLREKLMVMNSSIQPS